MLKCTERTATLVLRTVFSGFGILWNERKNHDAILSCVDGHIQLVVRIGIRSIVRAELAQRRQLARFGTKPRDWFHGG